MSTKFTVSTARTVNAVSDPAAKAVGLQSDLFFITCIIKGFFLMSESGSILLNMARMLKSLKLSLRKTHNQEVQL